MADGTERRSQIDTETVRGLQLINGGMAAGLVAMLPRFLEEPEYFTLGRYMVTGIVCAALGLVASIVHSRLRRKCSLEYDRKPENRGKPYTNRFLVKCQTVPGESRVCTRSIMWMWSSLAMFCMGAAIICVGFVRIEPIKRESAMACWELEQVNSGFIRFNRCTGEALGSRIAVITHKCSPCCRHW